MLTMLLSGSDMWRFFLAYAAAGGVAGALFSGIDESFSVIRACLATVLSQALLIFSCVILFDYSEETPEIFVLPLINLGITFVLLLILAAWFSFLYLNRDSDTYMEINDPEFSLLTVLRSKNKKEYYRSVHCAYLTEKCANVLRLNVSAAKTLAYYKEIGAIDGEGLAWGDVKHYFTDFDFPDEAKRLLQRYMNRDKTGTLPAEITVVMLCDEVVVKLTEIFEKDKNVRPDYAETVEAIFSEKMESGKLAGSAITVKQFSDMKEVLKKEGKYYDLLRG